MSFRWIASSGAIFGLYDTMTKSKFTHLFLCFFCLCSYKVFPQITERNRHKSPNGIATNHRKVAEVFGG